MKNIFLSVCLFLTTLSAEPPVKLTITGGFLYPESELVGKILKEVATRSNIHIDYDILPNKRSLMQANTGAVDGEASRIFEINKFYPNLLPVPAKIHSIDLIALTNKDVKLSDPSDLKPYNIGVIHGMKIAVLMAEKVKPRSIFKSHDHSTLMRMLAANRLDVVITNRMGLLTNLDNIAHNDRLYIQTKPLLSRELFMQLHKKNKRYIPVFEKAIKSMHQDGTFDKIQNEFYAPYEPKLEQAFIPLSN